MFVLVKANLTLKSMEWVSRILMDAWVLEAILDDESKILSSLTIGL